MTSPDKAQPAPTQTINRVPKASAILIPRPCILVEHMREGLRAELKEYDRKFLSLCTLMSVEAATVRMSRDYGICFASRIKLERHESAHGC